MKRKREGGSLGGIVSVILLGVERGEEGGDCSNTGQEEGERFERGSREREKTGVTRERSEERGGGRSLTFSEVERILLLMLLGAKIKSR